MRLIMLVPPGAGKGTQAALVAAAHAIPAISTGDIFRANIKDATPLGLKVKEITASGGYVPDEITNAIVRDRLAQDDVSLGFLLDGYPRTTGQVDALDEMLGDRGDYTTLGETIADSSAGPGALFEMSEMRGQLAEAIERMPEREKMVLTLYYFENMTLARIGDILNVTESRVSQIHTKAVLQLRSRLQAAQRELA